MSYNIVLTTAEDIVAVVDAVIAKGSEAAKDFIAEFTGIATDDQVLKALQMACELQLIVFDSSRGCYGSPSFLARKLVSASSDEQKAVFMRLILEQYAPYNTFKTRYGFTKSIELACRQTKTLHMMTSNERDVKNTLISIATYAKALKSEGANLYSFVEDVDAVGSLILQLINGDRFVVLKRVYFIIHHLTSNQFVLVMRCWHCSSDCSEVQLFLWRPEKKFNRAGIRADLSFSCFFCPNVLSL